MDRFVGPPAHEVVVLRDEVFAKHGIEPGRFLMVGNSPNSDIAPVIAAASSVNATRSVVEIVVVGPRPAKEIAETASTWSQ